MYIGNVLRVRAHHNHKPTHVAQRLQEIGRRPRFQYVTGDAGLQCSHDVRIVRIHREHYHFSTRRNANDLSSGINAIHHRHADVQNRNLREQLAGKLDCFGTVGSLARNDEIVVLQK